MGIRPKDFIQSVDGRALRNIGDFLGATSALSSERKMKIKLWRAQKEMTLEIITNGKDPTKP
jgi:S1-C subfamily serine protease